MTIQTVLLRGVPKVHINFNPASGPSIDLQFNWDYVSFSILNLGDLKPPRFYKFANLPYSSHVCPFISIHMTIQISWRKMFESFIWNKIVDEISKELDAFLIFFTQNLEAIPSVVMTPVWHWTSSPTSDCSTDKAKWKNKEPTTITRDNFYLDVAKWVSNEIAQIRMWSVEHMLHI